ncbi:hypothetical protein E4U50_004497 [Claviceps purpurea]|nr:hypothetical protein E4U28_006089 [Claviceps purpurea]KAG6174503.1 hypothetical protein E4U51_001764 [Claviceps purpurea]KAG6205796.1 hypothetical protein E4U50_004497 [Claviceps purpurea]
MPSPTPQPEPESQSPPPGPRAQRLHQIHAASLTRTLDKLAYENLAPCFPTIARRAEPILRQVQSQMVQKLREKSEAEFEAILRARGVVGKLNELEGVVAAAAEEQARVRAEEKRSGEGEGEDDRIPPHLLPPQDILAAHLSPRLAAHQSLLNARLQTTQAQNALLADHVRQQRQEMDELLGQLDRAVEDVRGANAVLGAVADELAAEARAVDGQLRAEMES